MILHGSGALPATAQSLLTLLFGATARPGDANDLACNFVSLQPDAAGTNPMFVGSSGVTTANYGTRLPAPSGGIPPAPFVIGSWSDKGPVRLSGIFVIGTAGETIHVLYCSW